MIKFLKTYLLILLLLVIGYSAQSQSIYKNYTSKLNEFASDSGSISVRVYNNNFVKNNEYFGPFTEGITYIGSILQPELNWALSSKFSLSTGWYFRQYYGHEGFEKSLPVIRASYRFKPGAQLIIGQLNGQLKHGYIEPLFNTDNYFSRNPEYGVQLLLDRKRTHVDFFMDWEKFLMPGDAHQEEIVGGLLASYQFNKYTNKQGLSAHLQSIIHHFGGQVDNSDAPLETRANVALGLDYSFLPKLKFLNSITLVSFYIKALELSQTNTIPYKSGIGTQNTITFENKWVKLSSGWFHGEKFFAPMGDFLFQSVSQFNDGYTADKRDLITSKLLIEKQIMEGISLGIRFESYYDIQRKWHDFSYGLNMSVNAELLKRNLKK